MRLFSSPFFSFLKQHPLPRSTDIALIRSRRFSPYTALCYSSLLLCIILSLTLLMRISERFSVIVPDDGGRLAIGMIGAPRYINPLLATSDTDRALASMVFSGLVRTDESGSLVPVLAKQMIASPEGTEYRFTLRDDAAFSDGSPITSADVLYTYDTKKRLTPTAPWQSLTIETPDAQTVVIRSTGSAASLVPLLSLGIISRDSWSLVGQTALSDSTLNITPVSSGPYEVTRIVYKRTVPKEVVLKRNSHYGGTPAFIPRITVHIAANQLDLKQLLIDGTVSTTDMLRGTYIDSTITNQFTISALPTTTTVALFTTQSSSTTAAIRAVEQSIDKNAIIAIIENGYGFTELGSGLSMTSSATDPAETLASLAKLGYTLDTTTVPAVLRKGTSPITLSIAVKKDDEQVRIAQLFSQELAKFGILSELQVFDQGTFIDHLQQGHYAFVLGTTADIRDGYSTLISLYTKASPRITAPSIKTDRSLSGGFGTIAEWFIRTDTVWKWFN